MPPAFETAAARGPPDVLAMPASMMGYLMPRSLHSGVVSCGCDIFDGIYCVYEQVKEWHAKVSSRTSSPYVDCLLSSVQRAVSGDPRRRSVRVQIQVWGDAEVAEAARHEHLV